jgi:hypothetical protein
MHQNIWLVGALALDSMERRSEIHKSLLLMFVYLTFVIYYTGRFIMFSLITNIIRRKPKKEWNCSQPQENRKSFFICVPRVIPHASIGYSSYCHTRFNMDASIFFTVAMIRAFRSAKSRRRVLCVLCTKCTLHSNHRLTRVIFQHTKRFLPQSGHFLTTYTRIV